MSTHLTATIPEISPNGGPGGPDEGREPSRIRALIGGPPISRATLLRGLAVAALAATLAPFDWYLTRRAARASRGPSSEWTSGDCKDAYPDGYSASDANWFSGPAACYGGWRIGSYPCNDANWHFEGSRADSDVGEEYTAHRTDSFCGSRDTRTAWRWTSGDDLYRCSDAMTTVTWRDGTRYRGLTIAMCEL
ncbi:hypothetical protein C1I98_03185 [Spongiactinospora gelatinilytica]|uniref:Uncharacterized protein n=1 Tax=Spongiactinospora gelatinilytica TaxID=2666298 RepID=A0A2W2I0J3_9ACTN|nr:hypothetical protein [Spongiactinospora gelatinilytica]PZG55518.1 hypothetical protein C1I98_03185 [Spongiactinospora gelatinilytica]